MTSAYGGVIIAPYETRFIYGQPHGNARHRTGRHPKGPEHAEVLFCRAREVPKTRSTVYCKASPQCTHFLPTIENRKLEANPKFSLVDKR